MSQDNIIREVDEELRSDRMRALWRRYGPIIIGAAVGVVLIVAGKEVWEWWQSSNAARSSDQFYAAMDLADGADPAAAHAALEDVIATGSGGYPTLARFKAAALLAKEGKPAEAVAAYDALATSESNPRLRELALVLAGNILVDSGTPADVETRVGTLAVPGNALSNSAREALGLAWYKAGDLTKAAGFFQAVIDDPTASADMASRMQLYMSQLVAQGFGDTSTAPVVDTPTVETPPASDVPATDAPVVDAPAADVPVETPPAAPASPVEAPAADAPTP
ncbi:MAG: hypothetical protein JWR75_1864 [Devosia sp.]|nr:hypothetical protein [Devosia sp.]